MPEIKFRVGDRFSDFLSRVQQEKYFNITFFIHIFGWFISLYASLATLKYGFPSLIPFIILLYYFWYKVLNHFYRRVKPPTEFLLAAFLLFYLLEMLWMDVFPSLALLQQLPDQFPGIPASAIQILLLGFLILIFSIILVMNNEGKKGFLYSYVILAFIGIRVLPTGANFQWYIFEFILVLVLFRKTNWTEQLTRVECWVYLLIFIGLYFSFSDAGKLYHPSHFTTGFYIWHSLPRFILLLFKLYLLAILIKLPFVLIYHHAGLSRKLRIAGWFQSGFPQLFQLIILLLMFYFFIAGWQAENVLNSLDDQLDKIEAGNRSYPEQYYTFSLDSLGSQITIPGYQSVPLENSVPSSGILQLDRTETDTAGQQLFSYFMFFKGTPNLYFVKLDTTFLQGMTEHLPLIAASRLISYPFKFSDWDSLLYQIRGFDISSYNNDFRVFPFAFVPYRASHIISVPLAPRGEKSESSGEHRILIFHRDTFVLGRIFGPFYKNSFVQNGYWAFDIAILPTTSFLTSPLMRQVYFWLVIYLLINFLIIRRVIKFGNQINQMIVQKFNQLKSGIRQISEGKLDYKIHLEGEDEFVELAERFNQMGEDLQKTINEVREKDRFEYELKIAREVQLSLLPASLPDVPGYNITAGLRTANEVGGDFYDVSQLDEHRLLFVIGDVSGKGTSAAFYMAQCISLFRFARQFSDQPKEILVRLNKYFSDPMVDRQVFVTALIGILDTKNHSLQIIRAGHTRPIFVPGDYLQDVQELESAGLGIGLERSGEIFQTMLDERSFSMDPGDTFIFYTDGVVEAARKSHTAASGDEMEFFGEDELKSTLYRSRGKNAQDILRNISAELENFYGGSSPVDDYTLLIIQRKAGTKDNPATT
ncbi:MAG: SpoIIE family protein phosphatase [Calditrichia bacterium]